MSLPSPQVQRALRHTRSVQIEAYAREDGLWDLDARLQDVRPRPTELLTGMREPHDPIHDLLLRITIDTDFNILAAASVSERVPYPGHCDSVSPHYQRLVGLNLRHGFRAALKERLAGTEGCTHITELAQFLPTAAIQAFAGDVINTVDGMTAPDGTQLMPFQLGRCYGLRRDGEAVARFYPRWKLEPENQESQPAVQGDALA